LVANIHFGGASLAEHIIGGLDPAARWFGLTGVILLAYVVAIPANEIVVPTVLMLIVLTHKLSGLGEGAGVMFEEGSANTLRILTADGWTVRTAICLMLFSLVHNPCSTTIYTIWKETRSVRWTAFASLLPVFLGFAICFVVAQVWGLFAGVLPR
jgi:ferrous iron transport protein B